MSDWRIAIGAVLLACGFGEWLLDSAPGQDVMELPAPQTQYGLPPKGARPPGLPPLRDPTQPNPRMRDKIEAAQGAGPPGAKPAPGQAPGMPQFRLRARIISKNADPVAVFEVANVGYVVHPDTTAILYEPYEGMQVRVIEISAKQVQVELLPAKKTLVIH